MEIAIAQLFCCFQERSSSKWHWIWFC